MAIKTGSAGAECGCAYAADGKMNARCAWHAELRQWGIMAVAVLAAGALYVVVMVGLMYLR